MSSKKHGFTIGIQREESEFYLTLKATGKLTHEDYEVITPVIDSALAEVKDPKVRVLMDCTELDGWELRAAWDDFKIGLSHGSEFQKIALIGHKNWLEMGAKVGAWFMSGDIKYFEDIEEGRTWLRS